MARRWREKEVQNFTGKLGVRAARKWLRSEAQNSTGKLGGKAEKAEETEIGRLELKVHLAEQGGHMGSYAIKGEIEFVDPLFSC